MKKNILVKKVKIELDKENKKWYNYVRSVVDPYFSTVGDTIKTLESIVSSQPKNKKAKEILEFLVDKTS